VRPPVALTQAPALFPQALVANSSQDPVLEQKACMATLPFPVPQGGCEAPRNPRGTSWV
jgi:hypothetical protein